MSALRKSTRVGNVVRRAGGRLAATLTVLALVAAPGQHAAAQGTPGSRAPWVSPALSNVPLPEWLSLSGEFRTRMESNSNLGYVDGATDTYGLVRTRINLDAHPSGWLQLFVQGQDSRAPGILRTRANGVFRDPFDLRQAYVKLGPGSGQLARTVGRQLLLYGDQKLIGPLDWTNTSRTWDAAKVQLRTSKIDVDVFTSWVVANDPTKAVNESDWDNGFYGVYATVRPGPAGLSVEPLLLWRTTPAVGSGFEGDRYSGGARMVYQTGAVSTSAMFVEQWGSVGPADIGARAASATASYTFSSPVKPVLMAEVNWATGDDDPADGTLGAFVDMFPTAHLYYGYNDLVGLRNIKNMRLRAGFSPLTRLSAAVDFHTFSLASKTDGLYNVAGAQTVAAPSGGATDGHVGEEVDVTFSLRLTETMSVAGGVGHMFPGAFLEANSGGAGNTFTHLALTARF